MTGKEVQKAFNNFVDEKNAIHRYASYDYCFNYFHSYNDKKELAAEDNIEKSCLHLGFYLASWGMFRGSSILLQKSLQFYKPIIKWIAEDCPASVWKIDVNNYNEDYIKELLFTYGKLAKFFEGHNELIIVTKIMLGVFGNTPAFDEYFTKTFRNNYGEISKFRSFNNKSLFAIITFYNDHKIMIEEFRNNSYTYNYQTEKFTTINYTRAKIIDMIGFGGQV